MKIVRAVLEIYEVCVQGQNDRQTDNPIFYKVETYLDRLLVPEINVILNFLTIVGTVLEKVNIYKFTYIYSHNFSSFIINRDTTLDSFSFPFVCGGGMRGVILLCLLGEVHPILQSVVENFHLYLSDQHFFFSTFLLHFKFSDTCLFPNRR